MQLELLFGPETQTGRCRGVPRIRGRGDALALANIKVLGTLPPQDSPLVS